MQLRNYLTITSEILLGHYTRHSHDSALRLYSYIQYASLQEHPSNIWANLLIPHLSTILPDS